MAFARRVWRRRGVREPCWFVLLLVGLAAQVGVFHPFVHLIAADVALSAGAELVAETPSQPFERGFVEIGGTEEPGGDGWIFDDRHDFEVDAVRGLLNRVLLDAVGGEQCRDASAVGPDHHFVSAVGDRVVGGLRVGALGVIGDGDAPGGYREGGGVDSV